MKKELAEKTAAAVLQSSFVLDSFLNILREELEPEEFKEYCQKFSKVIGEALIEVLNPIWKEHPELLPEKMGGNYKTNDNHYKNIYDLVLHQSNETGS